MKAIWYAVVVLLTSIGLTVAQEAEGPSPYPGGSPFPSGKEPSLTHVVEVYWTTMSDMQTQISINAKGDRPTQLHCVKVDGKMQETIASSIAPDCAYQIRIKPVKEKTDAWYAEGQGNLTVRVYGFNRQDFDTPPVVAVQYLKDGQLIGKTEVLATPAPAKFGNQQPEKGQEENAPDKKEDRPVTIERATGTEFLSMLAAYSSDGSSRYFIGFSEERAYCEARDMHGDVTIYWVRKAELDTGFLEDLKEELRRRYDALKGKDKAEPAAQGDGAKRAAP